MYKNDAVRLVCCPHPNFLALRASCSSPPRGRGQIGDIAHICSRIRTGNFVLSLLVQKSKAEEQLNGSLPLWGRGRVGAADNPRSDTIRYLNEYLPFTYTMSAQVYV